MSLGFIPGLRLCWRPGGLKKLFLGESYAYPEAEHLSPSVGCARSKRQYPTVLQHPKSLDAGLRMDGFPALGLWDVVIEVLPSTNKTKSPTNSVASGNGCETGNCLQNTPKPKQKFNLRC